MDNEVSRLKEKIIVTDKQAINQFGYQQQRKLSKLSDKLLRKVQEDNVIYVSMTLTSLLEIIKEIDLNILLSDNTPFYKRWFKRDEKKIHETYNWLQSISSRVYKKSYELDNNQKILSDDIKMLDGLFQESQQYVKELSNFIEAGEQRKYEIETEELVRAKSRANNTNSQVDIQNVLAIERYLKCLNKRIYDLYMTRKSTMQVALQIRMMQNVKQMLIERIQTSVMPTITLWENQIDVAMSIVRQYQMKNVMKRLSDATKNLNSYNSEVLINDMAKIIKELEQHVIQNKRLKQMQTTIVEMIDETMRVNKNKKRKII